MTHSLSAEEPSSAMAVAAGDASRMWTLFAGRLRTFVARRLPPGIEADDVVQEVFLRVMRHLPSLRDGGRIEAWLFQIARNALHDAMRARQRRDSRTDSLEIDLPDETDAGTVRAAEFELATCLTPMVARLADPYREAIELTSVHGLTQAEAATRAGVSFSGMKSRVQRGREHLKAMLLRCCEVHVDRRRGVADFHVRESASCAAPQASPSPAGCGTGACSPRRPSDACVQNDSGASSGVERRRGTSPSFEETDMTDATRTPATAPERRASTTRTQGASTCCGGPAPSGTDACCAHDAQVKSAGGPGCGCGSAAAPAAPAATKTGCCH